MAAVIKRFDENTIFLKVDDRFGSIADKGTLEFVEADVFYMADNSRNGEVVGNY
jgi:hypothetical protein